MDRLKPWQMVLLVVAVAVLGVSLWRAMSGEKVPTPGSVTVADVETGELFSIDTSGKKIAFLPARHPETGVKSLYPVRKQDDGSWHITRSGMGSFARYEGEAAAVTNRDLGVVETLDGRPKKLD